MPAAMASQSYPPQQPPAYHDSVFHEAQSPAVELPTSRDAPSRASSYRSLRKPVVVPQTTNMFYIRSFSPFARAYPPALAELPNPITQDEFIAFIDGLNNAHMMHPVFQASFVAGGMVMNAPILPVQLAGGGVQAISAIASGTVTVMRGRKYLKKANADMFNPRGLTVKICTTKKMMLAVGLSDKKLTLPPLNDLDDLDFTAAGASEEEQQMPEDPRMRRLRALEGHVTPITFDVPPEPLPEGALKRYSTAPSRWMNSRNVRKLLQAREKGLKQQKDKAAELDEELAAANREVAELERLAAAQETVEAQLMANHGHHRNVDQELADSLERRQQIVELIKKAGEKKMKKSDKKEEKVANRILWIVITRSEDAPPDDEELELEDSNSQ